MRNKNIKRNISIRKKMFKLGGLNLSRHGHDRDF